MKYATPNEFIQHYLEYTLQETERSAVKLSPYGAGESFEDYKWDQVDESKASLNDFLEGVYKPSLTLRFLGRFAVCLGHKIKLADVIDDLHVAEGGADDLLNYVNILRAEYDLEINIYMKFSGVSVSIFSPHTISTRKHVKRHAWYDRMGLDIDYIDSPDVNIALLIALIAAYDHGLWGTK